MDTDKDWMACQIDDIGRDTARILDRVKGDHIMGGLDAGLLALLKDKDGGWGDNLVLLFLALLLFGNNGFRGNNGAGIAGTDRTVINESKYSMLMDAVRGNGQAVQGLADRLGCDIGAVQTALAGVDKQIAMSGCSIQNAIQSCCCDLGSKIDKCYCETNLNVERTGNSILNALTDKFASQNAYLADQFCQIKLREQEETIEGLRAKVLEQSQDAQTRILLDAIGERGFGALGAKKQ